ncbi:MAG: hypothetical protein QM723_23075 [Myxococcaceae bacterium]
MKRALLAAFALSACVPVEQQTRTERGPLLKAFDRPQVVEGGVRGDISGDWPKLQLSVEGFHTCRTLHIEEYAEEVTTERSSSAAGPALSIGVVGTAVGAGLLIATPAVSNSPNTSVIDGGGHYGASSRQQVLGWGIASAVVGIPALIVGLVGYLHQGEETVTKKVEQVSGQEDHECNPRPMVGPVELMGESGAAAQVTLADGRGEIDASQVKSPYFDHLRFYGRPVELEDSSRRLLDAFSACIQLDRQPVASLEVVTTSELFRRLERIRSCRFLRADMDAAAKGVEGELQRRRDGGEPIGQSPGAPVDSWEAAMAQYQPKVKLAPGSADLSKLNAVDQLVNQAVQLDGVVEEGITANIGVVLVGDRQVYLFIPSDHAWGGDFPNGTRMEAVAVVTGMQTLDDRTLPLLRAVWMRPALGAP